jgi:hypothetical protein
VLRGARAIGQRLLELVEADKSWNLKRPVKNIHDRLSYLRRQAKKLSSQG